MMPSRRAISGACTRRPRGLAVLCAALVATILLAASASAGTPNTWTPAAPLNTGRFLDTSASLHNGDVLVAGGNTSSGNSTTSAEVYHFATDTWTSAGNMSTPRFAAVAVTLPSGKVLVVGGTTSNFGSGALDTGEVYDPSTNTWTAVANTMSSPRGNYPAVALLPNGSVLIAGGGDPSGNAVATADIYNPATNTFAPAAAMATARQLTVARTLPSGKVLVVGGQDSTGTPVATAEIYDPGTGSWSSASNSMSVARTYPGVAPLPNGDVLVVGGLTAGTSFNTSLLTTATTEIYDPATNSFTAGPAMAVGRVLFGITPVADGRVLAAGGVTFSNGGGAATGDTEVYDQRTNSWSEGGTFPGVAGLTLNLLPNGQALEAGGTSDFSNGSTQAALFTPASPPGAPVAISATPVTITPRGYVPIQLKCPLRARGGCKGTLTIRLARRPRHTPARIARCARGCRPLGRARFHIRAGQSIRVAVHISAYGRRLLAQHNALRATATATTVSGGRSTTTVSPITIRAPAGFKASHAARERSAPWFAEARTGTRTTRIGIRSEAWLPAIAPW